MEVTDEQRYAVASANRRLAAEMFAGLSDEQWTTPSLCEGWTVREVAAHLVPPSGGFSPVRLAVDVVRFRGDLDKMVDADTRRESRRPTSELVAQLRERVDERLKVPVLGAAGPMCDTAVHLRDAARPLGLDVNPEPAAWVPVLEFLTSKVATRGFVRRGLLGGLSLSATDQHWTHGAGLRVRGPSEAIAMVVAGRTVVLPELEGPGVAMLAERLLDGGQRRS